MRIASARGVCRLDTDEPNVAALYFEARAQRCRPPPPRGTLSPPHRARPKLRPARARRSLPPQHPWPTGRHAPNQPASEVSRHRRHRHPLFRVNVPGAAFSPPRIFPPALPDAPQWCSEASSVSRCFWGDRLGTRISGKSVTHLPQWAVVQRNHHTLEQCPPLITPKNCSCCFGHRGTAPRTPLLTLLHSCGASRDMDA